jgi:hypothetical protein
MLNTLTWQELCDDISDAYDEKYHEAVYKIRTYVQVLITNIDIEEVVDIQKRLVILKFIEDKFNTDINWFLAFIKKLNEKTWEIGSQKQLEQVLKDELWYEWTWICKRNQTIAIENIKLKIADS